MKRQAVADLQQRKLALISGIWANEGFNDEKGSRDEALEKLEEQFREAERIIFLGQAEQKRQQDQHKFTKEDEENPFLKPAIDATRGFKPQDDNEDKILTAVANEYDIDQS